jgi:hypothetical protein
MNLYQIKIGAGYVKSVFISFNDITVTPDIKRMKHVSEDEKDFVLRVFPQAEVKTFAVVEDNGFRGEALT